MDSSASGAALHRRMGQSTKAVFAAGLSVLGLASVAAWAEFPGKTASSSSVATPVTTTTFPASLSPLPVDSSAAKAAAQAATAQTSQTVVVQQAPIVQAAPPAQSPAATTRVS